MPSARSLINIAIDGYSSCGKSTLARDLAARLRYSYVDTGAMYRAISLFGMREGYLEKGGEVQVEDLANALEKVSIDFAPDPETGESKVLLNGEEVGDALRSPGVSEKVSHVATMTEVRRKLVKIQKQIAKKKGVVMDGRDIGTVVLPDAELKFFVTADEEVRAERRYRELSEKGFAASMEEVRKNVRERDHQDKNRQESPLQKAADAILLDTTELTPGDQLNIALDHFERVTGSYNR
ncbi:MAG: (d)CMP kinase [Flavobacteriales bacterium]